MIHDFMKILSYFLYAPLIPYWLYSSVRACHYQPSSSALEYSAWLRRLNLFSLGSKSQDEVFVSASTSEPNKYKNSLLFKKVSLPWQLFFHSNLFQYVFDSVNNVMKLFVLQLSWILKWNSVEMLFFNIPPWFIKLFYIQSLNNLKIMDRLLP
jgi:hypothetical protein